MKHQRLCVILVGICALSVLASDLPDPNYEDTVGHHRSKRTINLFGMFRRMMRGMFGGGGKKGGKKKGKGKGHGRPSTGYGTPQARPVSSGYGAPQRPQAGYGVPQGPALASGYGPGGDQGSGHNAQSSSQGGFNAPQQQGGHAGGGGGSYGGGGNNVGGSPGFTGGHGVGGGNGRPAGSIDSYGSPQGPVVGGGGGSIDSYGSPQGPVVGGNVDSYGSPQGGVIGNQGSARPVGGYVASGGGGGNFDQSSRPAMAPASLSNTVIKMLPAPNLATLAPNTAGGVAPQTIYGQANQGSFSGSSNFGAPAQSSYGSTSQTSFGGSFSPSQNINNGNSQFTQSVGTSNSVSAPDSYGIPQGNFLGSSQGGSVVTGGGVVGSSQGTVISQGNSLSTTNGGNTFSSGTGGSVSAPDSYGIPQGNVVGPSQTGSVVSQSNSLGSFGTGGNAAGTFGGSNSAVTNNGGGNAFSAPDSYGIPQGNVVGSTQSGSVISQGTSQSTSGAANVFGGTNSGSTNGGGNAFAAPDSYGIPQANAVGSTQTGSVISQGTSLGTSGAGNSLGVATGSNSGSTNGGGKAFAAPDSYGIPQANAVGSAQTGSVISQGTSLGTSGAGISVGVATGSSSGSTNSGANAFAAPDSYGIPQANAVGSTQTGSVISQGSSLGTSGTGNSLGVSGGSNSGSTNGGGDAFAAPNSYGIPQGDVVGSAPVGSVISQGSSLSTSGAVNAAGGVTSDFATSVTNGGGGGGDNVAFPAPDSYGIPEGNVIGGDSSTSQSGGTIIVSGNGAASSGSTNSVNSNGINNDYDNGDASNTFPGTTSGGVNSGSTLPAEQAPDSYGLPQGDPVSSNDANPVPEFISNDLSFGTPGIVPRTNPLDNAVLINRPINNPSINTNTGTNAISTNSFSSGNVISPSTSSGGSSTQSGRVNIGNSNTQTSNGFTSSANTNFLPSGSTGGSVSSNTNNRLSNPVGPPSSSSSTFNQAGTSSTNNNNNNNNQLTSFGNVIEDNDAPVGELVSTEIEDSVSSSATGDNQDRPTIVIDLSNGNNDVDLTNGVRDSGSTVRDVDLTGKSATTETPDVESNDDTNPFAGYDDVDEDYDDYSYLTEDEINDPFAGIPGLDPEAPGTVTEPSVTPAGITTQANRAGDLPGYTGGSSRPASNANSNRQISSPLLKPKSKPARPGQSLLAIRDGEFDATLYDDEVAFLEEYESGDEFSAKAEAPAQGTSIGVRKGKNKSSKTTRFEPAQYGDEYDDLYQYDDELPGAQGLDGSNEKGDKDIEFISVPLKIEEIGSLSNRPGDPTVILAGSPPENEEDNLRITTFKPQLLSIRGRGNNRKPLAIRRAKKRVEDIPPSAFHAFLVEPPNGAQSNNQKKRGVDWSEKLRERKRKKVWRQFRLD